MRNARNSFRNFLNLLMILFTFAVVNDLNFWNLNDLWARAQAVRKRRNYL